MLKWFVVDIVRPECTSAFSSLTRNLFSRSILNIIIQVFDIPVIINSLDLLKRG